ncbi:unnamed protein product [Aureobasidium uvarum]|uniref:Uncharacterized protein n=1 Tax=Aureobasidium uvarum TaxID=2773716 RepID=A0A9N8KDL2_9PEZI|nr:unnamed protein product [Aureobasidium uvarum]
MLNNVVYEPMLDQAHSVTDQADHDYLSDSFLFINSLSNDVFESQFESVLDQHEVDHIYHVANQTSHDYIPYYLITPLDDCDLCHQFHGHGGLPEFYLSI